MRWRLSGSRTTIHLFFGSLCSRRLPFVPLWLGCGLLLPGLLVMGWREGHILCRFVGSFWGPCEGLPSGILFGILVLC